MSKEDIAYEVTREGISFYYNGRLIAMTDMSTDELWIMILDKSFDIVEKVEWFVADKGVEWYKKTPTNDAIVLYLTNSQSKIFMRAVLEEVQSVSAKS